MARGEADLPGPGGGARRPGSGDGVLYAEGFFAGGDGASRAANPYPPESNAGVAWWQGWDDQRAEAETLRRLPGWLVRA